MSGYQIISLRNTPFVTGGETMMLDGIYDKIEGNNMKPILLDGIVIDGIEKPAVFAQAITSGSDYQFNVYGVTINITDTDAVSITADAGAGAGTDVGD